MTLKNDMIYNAGILCFILGLVCFAGAKSETATIFLVSLGAAFACTKFSGPFLVSSVFVALAVTSRRAASQWRRWLTIAALMAAAVLISSGHYYVKNILLYGNPFSPLGIRLFGWVLIPGIDFSGTSILSSLGDPELWRILLGLPSVSYPQSVRFPAGVLFPPMLITVLTVGVVCAARSMYKIFVARAPLSGTKLLTLPILIGWVLYAASIWSAHDHAAGEWFYLRDLMSLRYATATVLLSEMWIVLGLLRWRPGALLGPILLWISLLSRLYVLYFLFRPGVIRFAQGKADLVLLATVAVAAVLLVTMALRAARRPALRGAVLYTSFLGLMLCTPTVFEGHRAFWLPQWEPVNEALFNIPPSTVFLIGDSPYASSPYTVNGRGFRHHVTMGKEKDLWKIPWQTRRAPEFIVWQSFGPLEQPAVAHFVAQLGQHNYILIGQNTNSVVAYRVESETPGASTVAGEVEAWYVERLKGFPSLPSESSLQARTLEDESSLLVSNRPLGLWRQEGKMLRLASRKPGTLVRAVNLGGLRPGGRPGGLLLRLEETGWRVEEAARRELLDHYSVARALAPDSKLDPSWSAGGSGATETAILRDDEGPFLRLLARERMKWMAVIRRVADLPSAANLALLANVRFGVASGNVHLYDFDENGLVASQKLDARDTPGWQHLSLTWDFGQVRKRDYFAVGLIDPSPGDYIDIRDVRIVTGAVPNERTVALSTPATQDDRDGK